MYLCDSHLHTHLSFDGAPDATADAICRAAIHAGLAEITFTDHCDVNGELEGLYPALPLAQAREEVMSAREKYAGRLIVNWGIELGQPSEYPDAAAEILAAGGFDFVLGSLHNLPAVPDFYFMRFSDMPDALLDSLFARTLEAALDVVRFSGVHALAHLTYPCRYMARDGRSISLMQHRAALERLFAEMIARGVALEVNYSTLRANLGFTMPDEEILRLYHSVGGELITLGSDAHCPTDVAGGLDAAISLVRRCGFNSVVTYRGGKPYIHFIGANATDTDERKD